MVSPTLPQAQNLVRELSTQERLYLLHELTAHLLQEAGTGTEKQPTADLPLIHLERWPADLFLRREDLYNESH